MWEDGELTPRRAAMRRLADDARVLIEKLAGADPTDEAIERVAALMEQAASELAGAGSKGRSYEGFAESTIAGGAPHAHFDHSPIIGQANPIAPPLQVQRYDDRVVALATFGSAYEGPPGSVHGGMVAAAFDEVLGMAQSIGGTPGMTGTLTVKYRKPTPLHRELRFEGRVDRVDGRKIYTSAVLHAGERLCATATGLFISMKPEVFLRLRAARGAPAG